jgi:hypothetical protein
MALKNSYQLTELAYDAGFKASRKELNTAVAAAIGESGGNTRARGDNGDAWGLWQISLPHHPEYAKNPEQLYDAQINAAAAYKIYVEANRSFEPFHAYSHASVAKRLFLDQAANVGVTAWELAHPDAAFGLVTTQGKKEVQEKVIEGLGLEGMGEAVERLRKWVTTPANLGRMATAVVGVVIIIVGLAVLARPIIEPVAKTAVKATAAKATATKVAERTATKVAKETTAKTEKAAAKSE